MSECTLKELQSWFGSIILQPLTEEDTSQTFTPSGNPLQKEALRYINPSATLASHQRIQIYNQQYWWRLLNVLESNFPLLARLFGRAAFRYQVAVPFLSHSPPQDWSLNKLGDTLPEWLGAYYKGDDLVFVRQAAEIDACFTKSFLAPDEPPIPVDLLATRTETALLSTPLQVKKHLCFFSHQENWLSFRQTLLEKEVDYWVEHPFPPLIKQRTHRWVLFRNRCNVLAWRKMASKEYTLLFQLQNPCTLDQLCHFIEKQSPLFQKKAKEHLQHWLTHWIHSDWLTIPSENLL